MNDKFIDKMKMDSQAKNFETSLKVIGMNKR